MARFLVDESLPPLLAEALNDSGHEAIHAIEIELGGADDAAIYAAAEHRRAIVLTVDLDFSDIRLFPGEASIVVIRFRHPMNRDEFVARCITLIRRFAPQIDALRNEIMILELGRVRIRPRLP